MNTKVKISHLMEQSGVKFGTSGARGLARDMTDLVCYAYTAAFLQYLENSCQISKSDIIGIGGDLRPSTDRIMSAVAIGALDRGYKVCNYGKLPSPALALHGIEKQIPTIMVTGSHIPDDRNGIKFTKADGEILKQDEQEIRRQTITIPDSSFDQKGTLANSKSPGQPDGEALQRYVARYIDFFGRNVLSGCKIGVYQHSAVGRDILVSIFNTLGAETIALGRSEQFIPVDTEAIRNEDIELISKWAEEYRTDAIVSTDGDSDRPLISDENGVLFRGDVSGILCAKFIEADTIVTPVTSNTAVEQSGFFKQVIRTQVGSPYVIEAMNSAISQGAGKVCGYEANGGFLLATDISVGGRTLKALPTRDSMIVLISLLAMARRQGGRLSALLQSLPQRFTYSDRLKDFPTLVSHAKLKEFEGTNSEDSIRKIEAVFMRQFGSVDSINMLDGCRITFKDGNILHLRPSGNAPEFRCYTESGSPSKAHAIAHEAMKIMRTWV